MKITAFWIHNNLEDLEVHGIAGDYLSENDFLRYVAPAIEPNDLCGFLNLAKENIHIDHPRLRGNYMVLCKKSVSPKISEPPMPAVLPIEDDFLGILGDFLLVPISKRGNFKKLNGDLEEMCEAMVDFLFSTGGEVVGEDEDYEEVMNNVLCPQYRPIRAMEYKEELLASKDAFFYAESFKKELDSGLLDVREYQKILVDAIEYSNTLYARHNIDQMKRLYPLTRYTQYMENTESDEVIIKKLKEVHKKVFDRAKIYNEYVAEFLHIKEPTAFENPLRFFYHLGKVMEMVEKAETVIPFGRDVKEYKKKLNRMTDVFGFVMVVALLYNFFYDQVNFLEDKIDFLREESCK